MLENKSKEQDDKLLIGNKKAAELLQTIESLNVGYSLQVKSGAPFGLVLPCSYVLELFQILTEDDKLASSVIFVDRRGTGYHGGTRSHITPPPTNMNAVLYV